jgi:hypothetical protein
MHLIVPELGIITIHQSCSTREGRTNRTVTVLQEKAKEMSLLSSSNCTAS